MDIIEEQNEKAIYMGIVGKIETHTVHRPEIGVRYDQKTDCVVTNQEAFRLCYLEHIQRGEIRFQFKGYISNIIVDVSYGVSQKYSGVPEHKYRRSMAVEDIVIEDTQQRFYDFRQAEKILGIIALCVENYPMSSQAQQSKMGSQLNKVSFHQIPAQHILKKSEQEFLHLIWEARSKL